MTPRCACAFAACAFFFAWAQALAADLILEVIALRYRTVEQVLPVVQPLVPKPGTVSGMQNRLIVRTTASNLAEIRRVLEAIDREPRRLLITVRQDADASLGAAGARLSGDRPSVHVHGTRALENDRSSQQLQVLEGNEAFIQVGRSVPVPVHRIVREAVGGRVIERRVDAIEYRDILSGFHVRPRVSGDLVTVEVAPQRDTPAHLGPGSMNVQRASTTVSGRLGEWIELGGVVSGRARESSGTVYRTDAAATETRQILIRIDEIR